MKDLERILSLWRELETAGADFVLATVIAVEGPSYRKPGALMLLTGDGRRAGTVSGGCLEAEVSSRAWWLTANVPTIQRYSTADDDGERPYGSGCGGIVSLLLERRTTAAPLLAVLELAFARRTALAVATVVDGPELGRRAFAGFAEANDERRLSEDANDSAGRALSELAKRALDTRTSLHGAIEVAGGSCNAWVDYRPARPGLTIFGAGDDAQPLARMARELGWFVSVADGRSHLVTPARFPAADRTTILPIANMPVLPAHSIPVLPIENMPARVGAQTAFGGLHREDAVLVMTHSFEQDAKILACLLALDEKPGYIGVLGPQRRTRELLGEAARLLNLGGAAARDQADQDQADQDQADQEQADHDQADRWLSRLHAPTGLDLGADSPETIALAVLAEIQKCRTNSSGLPLREVRGVAVAVPQ